MTTTPSDLSRNVPPPAEEQLVAERLAEARSRLEREQGLHFRTINHFHKPVERPFVKSQRAHTTLLFGGLTFKHEKLILGVFHSLGYKCEMMPVPDVAAFQAGKEYGNNGQCNPTYFTVGNLVNFLQEKVAKGESREDVINNYVFITAGACGPCRFGMYEAEFRLALRNSGFDGFRVMLFQQTGGLSQSDVEAGLEMNPDFFIGLVNAINIGDLLNEVAHQIKPYEVQPGESERVLGEAMERMYESFRTHKKATPESKFGPVAGLLKKALGDKSATLATTFIDQLTNEHYREALRAVAAELNNIEVDRLRVKPVVKITGEFWAQTTEGDGNFNIFSFLEREGGEILVEPVATWLLYMMWQARDRNRERLGTKAADETSSPWDLKKRASSLAAHLKFQASLRTAETIFRHEYDKMRDSLGGTTHHLVDMDEMQRLGRPYYNPKSQGGEGHLEVSKNIYYSTKGLAHMVLSLKPFGCMPSTQSDGAQSAVTGHYKDMIYLPIETSGEGEINAHSRVQMALGEAKMKAKAEFLEALDSTGYTLEQIRAFVEAHPEMKKPLYLVPKREKVVGTAANFVLHVADRMKGQN